MRTALAKRDYVVKVRIERMCRIKTSSCLTSTNLADVPVTLKYLFPPKIFTNGTPLSCDIAGSHYPSGGTPNRRTLISTLPPKDLLSMHHAIGAVSGAVHLLIGTFPLSYLPLVCYSIGTAPRSLLLFMSQIIVAATDTISLSLLRQTQHVYLPRM